MTPRLAIALRTAAWACTQQAEGIRAALGDYDGAPDAPIRRTPNGMIESDAEEWEYDAKLILEAFGLEPWEG